MWKVPKTLFEKLKLKFFFVFVFSHSTL
jgi:hypothetical protein